MEEGPSNRHRFQSQASVLKHTHVPVLPSVEDTTVIPDASSSFYESLLSWRELNLTVSFTAFADEVDQLAKSMNLLLHNWQQVVEVWDHALRKAEVDALEPMFDLSSKLIYDLRTTLAPVYSRILDSLLARLNSKLPQKTLQALLNALSSLFKYLLVPSTASPILQETWTKIAAVLREGGEIARVVSEVWGKVIRRLKSAEREVLVESMLGEQGVEFYVAMALVEGMKSPNHGHPPSAPSLLRFILSYLSSHPDSETLLLTLKRVLTALLHHSTPTHFAPLMDALLDSRDLFTGDSVKAWMTVIRVPLAVRKGARLQETHLKRAIPLLPTLPHSPELVHLCTSSLVASTLPVWASEGKKMLTAVWDTEDEAFAILVSQSLCEAEWKGWNTFGLPLLLQHHRTILSTQPRTTLRLLAEMANRGSLQDVSGMTGGRGFLDTLGAWTTERIAGYHTLTEDDICDLSNILPLLPFLPSQPDVTHLIEQLVITDGVKEEWERTPANISWTLSACLKYALASGRTEGVILHLPTLLETWSWNVQVMDALADVVTALKKPVSPKLPSAALHSSILSQSSPMRVATLRILCSGSVDSTPDDIATFKHCLVAEEVPLSMEKVRERILNAERVTGLAGIDWLIAQLKINLRPLWQPACQAIAKIIQQHPEEAWSRVYQQLEAASLRPDELVEPEPRWPVFAVDDTSEGEEERTFRDPTLAKMDRLIACTTRSGYERELEILSKLQLEPKRLDTSNFEGQLLKTLTLVSNIAEKNNRTLISLLLRLVGDGAEDADVSSSRAAPRRVRSRLSHWLELFSKFSNPRALYRVATLQNIYLACLCTPERSLQRLAIDCLLTDSSSPLQSRADKFKLLLDDTKFRDELASLSLGDLPEDVRANVVPVLIRLLYGIMISRTSKATARRRAILSSLTSCTSHELETLVTLMLDPFQGIYLSSTPEQFKFSGTDITATRTQRLGYLRLLGDVLTYLAPVLRPHWPLLLTTTLELLRSAQTTIHTSRQSGDAGEDAGEAESEAASEDLSAKGESVRADYSIRQLGLKRLSNFCRRCPDLDLTAYLPQLFDAIISPRIPLLVSENSQAPSALMELFHAWSERQESCLYLTRYDASVIPAIADLLTATNVKPAVLSRVLEIFDHILTLSANESSVSTEVLKPNAEHLLMRLSTAISTYGNKPPNDIVKREIGLLTRLAPYLTDATHAEQLLVALKPLFRRTGKVMQERIVSDVLQIYASAFRLAPQAQNAFSAFFVEMYELLGGLFQTLQERQSRLSLVSAFNQLVDRHPEYALIGELSESLNAFLVNRPEEPDFDRRLAAFNIINETQYLIMGHLQWEPILWNALFYIQDPDELSIRTNAAFIIRRFIQRLHEQPIPEFKLVFTRVVYAGLRKALRSKSELVKSEVLGLLATATEQCDFTVALQEMRPLLAAGDEEASVFTNFYHVQIHRRTRALRRLAEQVKSGSLGSGVLTEVFIPLLNSYIMEGSVDHQVVHEAIVTLGVISTKLPWRSYYGLVQHYLRMSRRKTAAEKLFVRTVIVILEQFSFSLDAPAATEGETGIEDIENELEDAAEDGQIDLSLVGPATTVGASREQEFIEQRQKIVDVVKMRLFPTLLSYMDDKTATEDEVRIPIAYGIVCVALKLPEEDRLAQIDRLLTILCQVLRSRSHDTRQLARDTLFKIATVLGPDYLSKIVQSLREALTRGPQLHVLAVSVHGLLLHVTQSSHASQFASLDTCAANIAHIASEVIFGQSGRDVRNEGFKTTFKEIRRSSSKALDTIQLVSRFVTVSHVRDLLSPLRHILQSTDTQKTVHLVNTVLTRIASGLNSNPHLSPEDVLSLCHILITQRTKLGEESLPAAAGSGAAAPDFAVQMKRKAAEPTVTLTGNLQKFVAFGLDLFITAFRRNRFDLKDAKLLARLEPLVPLVGEALYTDDAQVAMASIKASAAILRCPLQSASKSLSVFIKRLLNLTRKSGSLDSEVAQAALKSLAIILRDCGKAKIVDADLKYLLELIGPELEEPERQSTAFTLLRSIIARQFVAPEIYDLMDRVFDVLVTNQSSQVREACRGIALQFLLDYPQGKGRLQKHMAFMATNLSYEFESGRLSLMELLGAVLEKFQPELLRDYVDMIFAALVMGLANDESTKCKEMGAALIKKLYARLNQEQQQTVLTRLHLWIKQVEQPELPSVATQVYGLLMDASSPVLDKESASVLQDLIQVVVRSDKEFQLVEEDETRMEVELDWRPPYHAMTSLSKLCRLYPSLILASEMPVQHIVSLFLFPHAWVRLAAARLAYIGLSAQSTQDGKELGTYTKEQLPLLVEVARLSTLQLRASGLEADMSLQVVKNLLFVGKCFSTVSVKPKTNPVSDAEDGASEGGEDDDDDEPRESGDDIAENPLAWLFSRLSFQLRRAHADRRKSSSISASLTSSNWGTQPLAILRWFAAMSAHLPAEVLEKFLPHILSPVYRLMEDDSTRDGTMEELRALCRELQDMLQQKVGTTPFAAVYNAIRQRVGTVRRERRAQRVVQVANDPEGAARYRMKRNVMKVQGRKRKATMHAEARGRIGDGKRRRFD
ncbi:hypothetical protein CALVIDRAFT_600365 [Calocera viscosa TUFC12733]|uniref:Uncharacterized protein n=1 Tax=Calocera viscosa (strain TUFC12733) TaxID=1330018 RepID=A0A167JTG2_CALVF|nr:hypothetical protein CALVIDRAFT_600365 [Calocera viscosa TUFC12733]